MNKRLLVQTVSALFSVSLLITGCASSGSEKVQLSAYEAKKQRETIIQTEVQTYLEDWLRRFMDFADTYDDNTNNLLRSCTESKEENASFLKIMPGIEKAREKFLDKLTPDMEFTYWNNACNIVINERPGAKEKLVAFQKQKEVDAEKAQVASAKFQKELDILDKKANKLGNGSYEEMLDAESALESLIEQGAQFSLTGQGRDVEDVSCSPTTYSSWSQGEPGGTWYCYLYFLDGSEPYTINVSGSRWGGKADRGSSAGDFVEFKVSSALKNWLATR
jgi:hypothetical protein